MNVPQAHFIRRSIAFDEHLRRILSATAFVAILLAFPLAGFGRKSAALRLRVDSLLSFRRLSDPETHPAAQRWHLNEFTDCDELIDPERGASLPMITSHSRKAG